MSEKIVMPAILADTKEEFWSQFNSLNGVADWIQIDILDGMYVDSTSVGLEDMEGLSPISNLEAHLLVIDPEEYLEPLAKLGFKRVIFHLDACEEPCEVMDKARELGLEVGLAINPNISIEAMEEYLDEIDMALLMSVVPGSQGQEFSPGALGRIAALREMMDEKPVSVDGGIKSDNIQQVMDAGADHACVGSAITKQPNPALAWQEMNKIINS